MLIEKLKAVTRQPAILVIGDLMIDHYIFGNANRLSPEAPVPVVSLLNESTTLGGAGNVVQNMLSLGANVMASGVVGNDIYGSQLTEILNGANINTNGIVADAGRTTTVKTRVLVGSHQMIRIDREVTSNLSPEIASKLLEAIAAQIEQADIVVLSDYNKGVFSEELTQQIIELARQKNKKIIVDPKGRSYQKYRGAYLIKPNKKELTEAANISAINTDEDLVAAAKIILQQTSAAYLVVTLSEDGIAIINNDELMKLPVEASSVFDVTGAGDTVLAVIAFALTTGFNLVEACKLANHAAAVVIQQVGSATITVNEIIDHIKEAEYDS